MTTPEIMSAINDNLIQLKERHGAAAVILAVATTRITELILADHNVSMQTREELVQLQMDLVTFFVDAKNKAGELDATNDQLEAALLDVGQLAQFFTLQEVGGATDQSTPNTTH